MPGQTILARRLSLRVLELSSQACLARGLRGVVLVLPSITKSARRRDRSLELASGADFTRSLPTCVLVLTRRAPRARTLLCVWLESTCTAVVAVFAVPAPSARTGHAIVLFLPGPATKVPVPGPRAARFLSSSRIPCVAVGAVSVTIRPVVPARRIRAEREKEEEEAREEDEAHGDSGTL